jgi:hypothetical protein
LEGAGGKKNILLPTNKLPEHSVSEGNSAEQDEIKLGDCEGYVTNMGMTERGELHSGEGNHHKTSQTLAIISSRLLFS